MEGFNSWFTSISHIFRNSRWTLFPCQNYDKWRFARGLKSTFIPKNVGCNNNRSYRHYCGEPHRCGKSEITKLEKLLQEKCKSSFNALYGNLGLLLKNSKE
jgi:hypothetical protein